MPMAVARQTDIERCRLHTLSLSRKRGLTYSPTAYILGAVSSRSTHIVKGLRFIIWLDGVAGMVFIIRGLEFSGAPPWRLR